MAKKDDVMAQATDDPEERFGSPEAVVAAADLSPEEKIELLERWRLDALRLADSEAEGMSGGETPALDEIERLLVQLRGG